MKKAFVIALTFFSICTFAKSQKDSLPKQNSLYWTFEIATSLLTNTDFVKNRPFVHDPSMTSSWYFYYDLPVGMNKSKQLNYGFSIAPGFGAEFNTFSIDKQLLEIQGKSEFINSSTGFSYSNFLLGFIDIPIDFRYLTKPNLKHQNFGFELGGKFGYLIYTEKEFVIQNGVDEIKTTTRHLNHFNNLRYGLCGKVSFRHLRLSKDLNEYVGLAYSLIANYYPSELFEDGQGIKSHYYSIGLGFSFIFK